ncbi:MAG: phosphate ABC transporter substrate-binding protein [Methanotrichaceae archaeon]|nr:phosphate ABC transporter substrate-binding protein [Methanotrichaceae archaeon]
MKTIYLAAVALAVAIIALSGCVTKDGPRMEVVDVTVSGSTTVMPLAEASAEEFNRIGNAYHVSVTGGGSGVGITNIAEGRSKIGMASREIKSSERERFQNGDKKFEEHLIAYDGICIAVSQLIYDSGVTSLSRDEARAIYNGEITNWMEVGGPDEEIYVVARELGSGTRDTFNEMVMGDLKAETPGIQTVGASNSEIKTAVTSSDHAIGYLGYNYVQSGPIRALAYDGVKPTIENITDGSYPLTRKLYFYTFGKPSPGAQAFIDFIRGPKGRAIAEENGYIPA